MSGDVSDLIGRLLHGPYDMQSCIDIRREAATALEAQEKEIEALRERVKELEASLGSKRDAIAEYIVGDDQSELAQARASEAYMSGALSREIELCRAAEARAETAERQAKQASACCDSYVNENQKLHDRMEEAERERDKARAALKPFAEVATYDIGSDETDDDYFRPIQNNHARRLRVGHLRAARAVIEKNTND